MQRLAHTRSYCLLLPPYNYRHSDPDHSTSRFNGIRVLRYVFDLVIGRPLQDFLRSIDFFSQCKIKTSHDPFALPIELLCRFLFTSFFLFLYCLHFSHSSHACYPTLIASDCISNYFFLSCVLYDSHVCRARQCVYAYYL